MDSALKTLRENAALSQAELAAALEVNPVTVSRWEIGMRRPRNKHIRKMAEVFHVELQVVVDAVRETTRHNPDASEE
jgi:transcriptional regulator with XRE-family HTH domain